MSYFKVEYLSTAQSVVVKGDTTDEIIKNTLEKLELPSGDYRLVLDDKKTTVDADVIAFAVARSSTTNLFFNLFMLSTEVSNDVIEQPQNKDDATKSKADDSTSSSIQLNLQSGVWSKVFSGTMKKIGDKKRLNASERINLVQKIADYMRNDLKNTTRGLANKIATLICTTYPDSLANHIENEKWGDGIATLRTSIVNRLQYLTGSNKSNKRKASDSLDEDEIEVRIQQKEAEISRKQDEYGCVEYSAELPSDETNETQEEKRLLLLEYFNKIDHENSEVYKMMEATYATQRQIINNPLRDIDNMILYWPFLTDVKCLIQHGNRLLGKDILTTWNNSLNNKGKFIRQYLKTCDSFKKNKNVEIAKIIEESNAAQEIRKDNVPSHLVIFPLLLMYFEEEANHLYKIIDEDTSDKAAMEGVTENYPILLIRGKSLYDPNSTCSVIVEKKAMIYCSNSLEGLLMTFFFYYIFGYTYNPKLEKMLEFIQRIILQINPPHGRKTAPGKKRCTKGFHSAVFKIAKALSNFADPFKIDD